MTEEFKQKAEDFYFKKYTRTLDIGEEERQKAITEAYIAGATEVTKELQEELKIQKHNTHTVAYLGDCIEDIQDKKIAEAKEHIRTLISCLIDWVQEGDKDYCHIAEAEAFLKE